MANLLILEPDDRLRRNMCRVLQKTGHRCCAAGSVAEGEAKLTSGQRMMTILNTRLPWTQSRPFLRALEEKGLPVLFLAQDAANAAHLKALYPACSEVLVAPFTGLQLANAVFTLLKEANKTLMHGKLRMDVEKRQVTQDGKPLRLTTQEFELLRALMLKPDTAVTREELLRKAWGYQGMGVTRTVDVHVQRLRRKLGAAAIETVYKTGYRLRAV